MTLKAAPAKEASDLERIVRLASGVRRAVYGALLTALRHKHGLYQVVVAIEYPIMKAGNVVNFRKQAATFHAIESALFEHQVMEWLIEINPTSAKVAATGSGAATKAEIIAASPFAGSGSTVETLADAWAIARAGREAWARSQRPYGNTDALVVDVRVASAEPYPIHAQEFADDSERVERVAGGEGGAASREPGSGGPRGDGDGDQERAPDPDHGAA